MFSVCDLVAFSDDSAFLLDFDICYNVDLRKTNRTPIIPTIWIFINLIMASSERRCCVTKCGKSRKNDVVLHSFPNPMKDLNRYLEWARAVGCDSLEPVYVYKNRRVCHDHFETQYLTWTRRLSPNAVPTLLLPRSDIARTVMMDITNIPSTSTGFDMPGVHIPVSPFTSTDLIQPQQSMQSKSKLGGNCEPKIFYKENKALLTAMKKIQAKKDRYAIRLKKALNLSENPTFLRSLKQFTTLASIFTIMQFREIGKKKMGHRFTGPEKIMALSLYKRSPRTYRWLQKIFVLPSAMTLNRVIARANLKPGLNANIFNQLKVRALKMKENEKLCFLLFDEMSISPHFFYSQRKDLILGFIDDGKTRLNKLTDHVLVFMIRGVQKNYKQSVAYTFCSGSTSKFDLANMIKEIIRKLNEVGLIVVGTICDQGTSNTGAINILIEETRADYLRKENKELRHEIFEVDGMEVVPVYDPPHLIKGIRNNLLQKNLICSIDGVTKIAKWEHIAKLYEEDPAYKGIRLVKKLTNTHVNPNKFEKMKVKYATQALSQRVAVTMGFLAGKNILPPECAETADVIMFFDDLFDSLNGSFKNSKKRGGKELLAAVTPKSCHHNVWIEAKNVLYTMNFINKDGKQVKVPTINNWLRTINNVEYLIKILANKFKVKSVWMRHFNQDPLENFFGSIRSHGCRNINPTPAGFESTFAALLINNLSSQHSPGSNCEEDSCTIIFHSMESLFSLKKNKSINTNLIFMDSDQVFTNFEEKMQNPRILATLQYVTGYIFRKAKRLIFRNCMTCNACFFDQNNSCEYIKLRQYKKGKLNLCHPKLELVKLFSYIQDVIVYNIKKNPSMPNLKTYLKTVILTEIDFKVLNCKNHKVQTVDYVSELSCMFFICNWCRDINRILSGKSKLDDVSDNMKLIASNYYNKKKHFK